MEFIAPPGFETWNRALRGAYRRGWNDAMGGKYKCPYEDKRKDCGRLTWSRSFICAWGDGAAAAISAKGGTL